MACINPFQEVGGPRKATTFFAKKPRPPGPPFPIKTYASQDGRAEEKDWNRALCNGLSMIQYGDYEPSSAVETKTFLLS